MSGDDDDAAAAVDVEKLLHCASCGRAEIDDAKLTECNSCDLVRYCSDECQADHKSQHEEECKKRAAELRDELLFNQPESTHLGDCPICMIPLPLDDEKYIMRPCCCKFICQGCMYQNIDREMKERRRLPNCPFCRQPLPSMDNGEEYCQEEFTKQLMKRLNADDPEALCRIGSDHYVKGDYSGAFELYTKATELGHLDAHYKLAIMYFEGNGVEKDSGKESHHLEEAAIGGHPTARHELGNHEIEYGDPERGVKHWIIAANQGHVESMKCLVRVIKSFIYLGGCSFFSKDDLTATLRGHQSAIEATKSPQRKEAATFYGTH